MPDLCRLYLLTPPRFEPALSAPLLAAALDAGDVAAVRLRLEDADDDTLRRAIDLLRPVAQSRDVAFILNDRPDLAAQHGCDGAHIDATMDPIRARTLLGADRQLGVSCGTSRDAAMTAGERGADYVALGPWGPSPTELTDLIRWWSETMELPVVAAGEIDAATCAPLVAAGADFLAVATAIWDHPDGPAAGVRTINDAIAAALPSLRA